MEMSDFHVLYPVLSDGKKWYPVRAWCGSVIRQLRIVEYFESKEEAVKWIEDKKK